MSTKTTKDQEKQGGTAKAASSSGNSTGSLQALSGLSGSAFNAAANAARAAYQQRTAGNTGSTTQQSTGRSVAGNQLTGGSYTPGTQHTVTVGNVHYIVSPNDPTANMTNQERALAFGMIMKDPEIVNRAYTRVGESAAAAHTALQSGVTTPEALQQVRSNLDDMQTGITTLRTIQAAMGMAGPENIQDIINQAQSSYNTMQSNYDSMASRFSPMAKGVGTNLGLNPATRQYTDPITQMTQRSGIGIPTVTTPAQRTQAAQAAAQAGQTEEQLEEIRTTAQNIMAEQGSAAASAYLAKQGIVVNNIDDWNEFLGSVPWWKRLGNIFGAAGQQYAGSVVGTAATGAEALSRMGSDDALATNMDVASQQVRQLQEERQAYIDESVKRGYTPDAAILEQYDQQIAAASPETVRENARQAAAQARENRQALYDTSADLMTRGAEKQAEAKQGLGTVGSFLVDTGVAGSQMLMDLAVGGITGGSTMAPMLVRSFGGGASQAAQDGGGLGEQIYQGTKQAAIEWITEKLFAGNPVYDEGGGLVTDAIYNVASRFGMNKTVARYLESLPAEMLGEGLEEVLSDVLNPVADRIANWIDGGARETDMPELDTLLSDFAVGAALGGLGQGGQAVVQRGQTAARDRAAGRQIQQDGTVQALRDVAGYVGRDVNVADNASPRQLGRAFREVQDAYMDRAVEARLEDLGETATPELVEAVRQKADGKWLKRPQFEAYNRSGIADQVIREYEQAMQGNVNTENMWAYDALLRAEDLSTETEETEQEQENENAPAEERQGAEEFTDRTETEAEEDYTPAERLDRQILQREMNEVAEIAGQESGTDVMVQLNNKMQTMERDRNNALADMDIPAAEAYTRVMETVQRATAAAAAVDVTQGGDPVQLRADAMRDVINNEFGGYNYADQNTAGREEGQFGRAPGYDRAAGRNDYSPADVRGGEIQGVGDQDALRGGNQEGRRGYGPAPEGTIQTSAKAIGIPKGTERALNYLPQAYHTEQQTRLRKEAESLGVNLDFVYGRIELSRDDGSTYEVDGIQYGNQVVVNCNSSRYTEGQLTIHELVHARARKDPGLVIEAVDRIRSRMTEEAWIRMLSDYMRGSKMIYHQLEMERLGRDLTAEELDALDLKYAEEIVADAAAGISRLYTSGEGAAAYTEDVNALIREREGMGNGSGGMPGSRFMFAGEKARTANQQALSNAQAMEDRGEDSEAIRQETGWFRGLDGEWRFEISDEGAEWHRHGDAAALRNYPAYARYNELMDKMLYGTLTEEEETELRRLDGIYGYEQRRLSEIIENGRATLNMLLDHPALFEAYPELMNVRVQYDDLGNTNGSYNPRSRTITLNEKLKYNDIDLMRTVIHEIQHAVQSIEGFTPGASVEYWANGRRDRVAAAELRLGMLGEDLQRAQDFVDMLERNNWEKDSDQYQKGVEHLQEIQQKYTEAEADLEQARETSSVEMYRRTAGEIEARDAEERRRMNDEWRKNTRPDIDREDAVFAEGDGDAYEQELGHLKDQIRKALNELNKMDPVANITDDLNMGNTRAENLAWLQGKLEHTGFKVEREGRGTIQFPKSRLSRALKFASTDSERAALLALPEVLKYGREIHSEDIHKGREYGSFTVGAPVVINGHDGVMGAVVKQTTGNYFYASRILTPDGKMLVLERTTDAEPTTAGALSETDTHATPISSASMNSISDSEGNSNTEIEGVQSRFDNLTAADRARTEARRQAEAEQEAEVRYSIADEDIGEIGEREQEAAQEASRAAEIERMTPKELRRAVAEDREDVRSLRKFLERDIPAELKAQMQREIDGIESRLQAEEARLREHDQKVRQERAQAKERAKARQVPTQSRADLVQRTMDLFSIHEGRAALGNMMGAAFDDARSLGRFTEEARERLFNKFIDAGYVSAAADPYYQDIRRNIAGTRIYVPQEIRSEFGDKQSYNAFRRYAQSAGVTLTSDPTDLRIDGLHAELADAFPGAFDRTSTDETEMLRAMVDLAMEGKNENVSLPEMMQRVQDQEGWSVDDQVDHLKDQFDRIIDEAMYAAGIEVEQKTKSAMQIAKERTERRQAMERQATQRAMREQQHKTFSALRWLQKHRNRTPAEMQARIDEITDGINLITMNAANEMRWSERHQATYRDLAAMYKDAKLNDPNWMPSRELEDLISKLEDKAIADMDMDELETLYKAASALRTEFYNRNNMINDELHRTFAEVYDGVSEELGTSGGRGSLGKGLAKLTNAEMMTPMNILDMMGGWRKGGQLMSMARQLQAGERRMKGYVAESRAMLDEFNRDYEDWVRKADGQGKDAIWYEIEVPELMELHMGDKPIFGNTVKVYMTPMQKVELYLESKNYQNLQHMTGGRTFVNRELYAKGKRSEALAQGTTVRLAPETVKNIVSNMTAEEMALANILERYYNEKARDEINAVSNPLYGYDKAMIDYYVPIFTDANYNKSTAGKFDVTAEGVGHMKSREQVSKNPSYNLSAIDAFERHIDQTSRFVGLSIPIRNMETLMNWYGNGTTTKKTIAEHWGKEGVDYITDLMTRLQSPETAPKGVLQQITDKAVSNYITAVFGANPGIVFKQAASYPAAAAVLGFENMPAFRFRPRVNEELIGKYTPELAYRKLGYATPEIQQMRNNPSLLDRNRFTRFAFRGGAIQAMDAVTVGNLWTWAENYVRKNQPGLEMGTQEQIDAGQSPFYRAVADAFNEAVNVTQPMYDTMNRAKIMDNKDALSRTFSLFKTVPMQEYNTLRRYLSQAKNGDKAAKRQAAQAVGSILVSTLMIEGIGAAFAWVKNGLKGYRDDDDELTAQSFATQYLMNVGSDLAGIMIGGSEIFEAITNKLTGGKGGSTDFQIIGSEQINDLKNTFEDGGALLQKALGGYINVVQNGGDGGDYLKRNGGDILGGIHDLASKLSMYLGGFPTENIEKYLGGILEKAFPNAAAFLDSVIDTTTKRDLDYINKAELPARLDSLLAIRNIEADEGTSAELARLYLAGYKTAVPADTPDEIKDQDLSAYEMQEFDSAYTRIIGEHLNSLVESDAYIDADDEERAEMLGMLYIYATQNASADIIDGYEFSSGNAWVGKANEAAQSGVDVVTYIQARQAMKAADAASDGNGTITQAEAEEALSGMDLTDDQRAVLWQLTNKSWKADKNPFGAGYVPTEEGTEDEATAPAAAAAEIPAETSGTAAQPVEEPEEEKPDPTDRKFIRSLYTDLKPPEGMDKVTQTQKYRAIIDAFDSVDDQVTALETEMSDTELEKIACGRSHAVTPDMYVTAKETMYAIDDEGDNDNSTSQAEAKYALDSMDYLTNEERAVLWQLTNKSWKPYVNPYDTEIGQLVYDEMHGNAPIGDPTDSGTGRRTSQPEMPQITWNVPEIRLPTYG